ncbi:MAG: HD domain-containing protein [Planctomycetota bacterium]|nr:HD domain-containing protein [Planctomycetota bacterium]
MPRLGPRFQDALAFAAEVHAAQSRKGTPIPYVSHLLHVTGIVLEHGADEDVAIAALLHDAAEDQGGHEMLAEIEARFGSRVAGIVLECSDTLDDPKPPWRERKEHYLAHLESATEGACLVSGADKLHNARTIVDDLRREGTPAFAKFKGGHEGTLWYYAAVLEALEGRIPAALHAELRRTVAAMQELAARA